MDREPDSTPTTEQEGDPDSSVLAGLVATVLADSAEVTRDGVAEILRNVPDYQRGDTVTEAELTRQLRANIEGILAAFGGADPDARRLVAMATRTGRARAEQGVALESLLQAYRLGAQAIWRHLLAHSQAGPQPVRDELLNQAIRLWTVIDTASSAVADAYHDRDRELSRRADLHRDSLVDALLGGRGDDPVIAEAATTTLGLPAAGRYAAVCVSAAGPDPDACGRRLGQVLTAYRVHSLWRSRMDRELGIVLLGDLTVQRLASLLAGQVEQPIGASAEVAGLGQLGVAAAQAELAAATLTPSEPAVALLDDRLPEALLVSAAPLADRLRDKYLGRILELPDEERDVLLGTLDVWLRTGRSAALTARQLHCHRNTVFNRVKRIEELAGGIDGPREAVAFHLAVLAHRLTPDSLDRGGAEG